MCNSIDNDANTNLVVCHHGDDMGAPTRHLTTNEHGKHAHQSIGTCLTSNPSRASTIRGESTSSWLPCPRTPSAPFPKVMTIPRSLRQAPKLSPHATCLMVTPDNPRTIFAVHAALIAVNENEIYTNRSPCI